MSDTREWTTETELVPRCGWRVVVRCQGETQGCWGDFRTERQAARYGRSQIRRLLPITPPGTEVRMGGGWA